jgi:hypothetical protein
MPLCQCWSMQRINAPGCRSTEPGTSLMASVCYLSSLLQQRHGWWPCHLALSYLFEYSPSGCMHSSVIDAKSGCDLL